MFPIRKRGRHIIFDVCSNEGKYERRIVAKSHGVEAGYKELKNLLWGDLWRFGKRIPNKYRKEGHRQARLW